MKKISIILTMMALALLSIAQSSIGHQSAQDSTKVDPSNQQRRSSMQPINLSNGWSGVSSYLNPSNPDVALLMAAIEDQLVILRDFDGNVYQPAAKGTLINWDFKQGYYIKMASAETLEITGFDPL
jgi:myo-inositol-hexaphosphate 3-phosphohydrolase